MRQRQIQQATAAAEREALLAAPRIARGAGIVGRAAGLVGRAAAVAAAPETTAALALGGLAYGVGEDLLSNYGSANSTKSMPQRQRTPLTDPTSRGTHKVQHKHSGVIYDPTISTTPQQPEVQAAPAPVSSPVTPPRPEIAQPLPQQPEVQAAPAPVASPVIPARPEIAQPPPQQPEVQAVAQPSAPVAQPPIPGRFERSLIDLRGRPAPVHGFRISRTQPYTLTAWERAARAKAQAVRGY